MQSFVLKLDNLTKIFDSRVVIEEISLALSSGEILAICGPSGVGKTTLLHIIAGLESATSGNIIKNGEVGMVFQTDNLFDHLTVFDNLKLGLVHGKKLTSAAAENIILEHIRNFGLEHLIDKYPSEISGGEEQRVAYIRLLCMNYDICLLDEPTSNLDPISKKSVIDSIGELSAHKKSVIISTHDLSVVRNVATKVLYLSKTGHWCMFGTIQDFIDQKINHQHIDSEIKNFLIYG